MYGSTRFNVSDHKNQTTYYETSKFALQNFTLTLRLKKKIQFGRLNGSIINKVRILYSSVAKSLDQPVNICTSKPDNYNKFKLMHIRKFIEQTLD